MKMPILRRKGGETEIILEPETPEEEQIVEALRRAKTVKLKQGMSSESCKSDTGFVLSGATV